MSTTNLPSLFQFDYASDAAKTLMEPSFWMKSGSSDLLSQLNPSYFNFSLPPFNVEKKESVQNAPTQVATTPVSEAELKETKKRNREEFEGVTTLVPLSAMPEKKFDTSDSTAIVLSNKESRYVDVTNYLIFPQHIAAQKIGIPPSTLAKRWKEASVNRKWPYRTVAKLDKEIATLLRQKGSGNLPAHVESTLTTLLKKRSEELTNVIIRI